MLIMQSTKIPFQDLADRIASDFFEKGISLEDGVVRIATERDMLPEEVRRLAEKSNTAASILYLKNSKNKKGSFELANADTCVGRTHPVDSAKVEDTPEKDSAGVEPEATKTASEFPVTRKELLEKNAFIDAAGAMLSGVTAGQMALLGVPAAILGQKYMRNIVRDNAQRSLAVNTALKNKAINRATALVGVPVAGAAALSALNSMDDMKKRHEKKAEEYTLREAFQLRTDVDKARQAKIACELRMQDCLNKTVNTFKFRSAEAFDKFASDAIALCGDCVAPVLSSVAEHLKYEVTFQKAALVVDDTKEEMATMLKLAEELRDYPQVCQRLEALEQELASFNKSIEQYTTL